MGWASYREGIVSRYGAAIRPAPLGQVAMTERHVRGKSTAKPTSCTEVEISKLKEFTVSSARPLPVVLLVDVSGSMSADGKIDALNAAVAEMLAAFAEEDDGRAEIHVAVVTFGGKAAVHAPLQPARGVRWTPMRANGRTPMRAAIDLVTD